jgi:general secretion pathway protein H
MEKTKTSQLKIYNKSHSTDPLGKENAFFSNGFTLLEVMIVLALVSAIVVLGIPRIKGPENNVKSILRHLTVLSREIRNESRAKNKTHRLVFNLEEGKQSYWVEATEGMVLTPEKQEDSKKNEQEKSESAAANSFSKSEKFFKGVKKIPDGVLIHAVETTWEAEPVKQGKAYVYYSPQGMVDKAVVVFKSSKTIPRENFWSLVTNPLTGQMGVFEKEVLLRDLKVE